MTDIVSPERRSKIMSQIRGRDTKLEIKIRKALWHQGFRYRLPKKKNYLGLPGVPDIVLSKYRAVILINGCFFHGHSCALFRLPEQNRERWAEKIAKNKERDARFSRIRQKKGWKTLTIWECSLRGKDKHSFEYVIQTTTHWLKFEQNDADIEHGRTLPRK